MQFHKINLVGPRFYGQRSLVRPHAVEPVRARVHVDAEVRSLQRGADQAPVDIQIRVGLIGMRIGAVDVNRRGAGWVMNCLASASRWREACGVEAQPAEDREQQHEQRQGFQGCRAWP